MVVVVAVAVAAGVRKQGVEMARVAAGIAVVVVVVVVVGVRKRGVEMERAAAEIAVVVVVVVVVMVVVVGVRKHVWRTSKGTGSLWRCKKGLKGV